MFGEKMCERCLTEQDIKSMKPISGGLLVPLVIAAVLVWVPVVLMGIVALRTLALGYVLFTLAFGLVGVYVASKAEQEGNAYYRNNRYGHPLALILDETG